MIWVADNAALPPRVGYAIGRAVGTAVDRNRVRRRLRAIFAEQARAERVPAGLYLVGARASASGATSAALATDLDRLLTLVATRTAAKVVR